MNNYSPHHQVSPEGVHQDPLASGVLYQPQPPTMHHPTPHLSGTIEIDGVEYVSTIVDNGIRRVPAWMPVSRSSSVSSMPARFDPPMSVDGVGPAFQRDAGARAARSQTISLPMNPDTSYLQAYQGQGPSMTPGAAPPAYPWSAQFPPYAHQYLGLAGPQTGTGQQPLAEYEQPFALRPPLMFPAGGQVAQQAAPVVDQFGTSHVPHQFPMQHEGAAGPQHFDQFHQDLGPAGSVADYFNGMQDPGQSDDKQQEDACLPRPASAAQQTDQSYGISGPSPGSGGLQFVFPPDTLLNNSSHPMADSGGSVFGMQQRVPSPREPMIYHPRPCVPALAQSVRNRQQMQQLLRDLQSRANAANSSAAHRQPVAGAHNHVDRASESENPLQQQQRGHAKQAENQHQPGQSPASNGSGVVVSVDDNANNDEEDDEDFVDKDDEEEDEKDEGGNDADEEDEDEDYESEERDDGY
ncbi:hypothetical protein WOLCODRAFT_135511 [Wolfiporia cocos MD-104 SS10]|uniref:Uncharacterized protein n=1 Tax=Wolfiporia cocos (strain MD-104) TaxID=742152 RepID=A0A2H3IXE7_WOLCO|nr:hypothetical protein WOLCODRAFT_135511 [Wolfiporia cocos MD-104 SS10]